MDIAGAKALKERLGGKEADDAPVVRAVSGGDAPPVYHYLGVGKAQADAAASAGEDAAPARRSWLRRRRADLR